LGIRLSFELATEEEENDIPFDILIKNFMLFDQDYYEMIFYNQTLK
jgi:hypothetical protein